MTSLACMIVLNMVIVWANSTRIAAFKEYLVDMFTGNSLPITTQFLLSMSHGGYAKVALGVASAALWAVARVPVTNSVLRIGCFLLVLALGLMTMGIFLAHLTGPMDAVEVIYLQKTRGG